MTGQMKTGWGRWWRGAACVVVALAVLAGIVPAVGPVAAADGAYRIMVGRVDSSKFPEVRFTTTVLDHQYIPVTNLTAGQWELLEDGKPVKATSLAPIVEADNPITIVLGLDANSAMDGKPLKDTKDAATDFIFNLQPKDNAAALSFGDRVTLLHRFTTDRPAMAARIRDARAIGVSVLYDGVAEALDMAAREPGGRKVLVFLSDGQDGGSRKTLNEVIARAGELRIPIFTIGLGEDVNMDALRKLADASGGVALYAPTSGDVLGAYQTISNHLRSEFSITFRSNLKADGAKHNLTIRPTLDGARLSDPIAFTATKNPPTVELLTPPVNTELADEQFVEAKVAGLSEITRVEFSANGRVLANLDAPPWQFTWNTEDLKGGQVTLNVTAIDAAENRTVKFIPLIARPRQEVVVAMRAPAAPAAVNTGGGGFQVPMWVFFAVGALPILFVVYRAGRWSTARYVPLRCSTHRVTYPRGGVCPRCAADADPLIDNRLRRFARVEADEPVREKVSA